MSETDAALPTTLPAVLTSAAEHNRGGLHFHLEDGVCTLTASELLDRAAGAATVLEQLGIEPGASVGVLGPNRPEWAVAAFGTWLAGGVVVPLPFSFLQDPQSAGKQLRPLLDATDCGLVLVASELSDVPLPQARSWHLRSTSKSRGQARHESDSAVIQPTSGSTGRPKGVVLTHEAILTAVRASSAAQGFEPGYDRLLGWLPLFHDYGLFGFLLRAFVTGVDSHILPVESFARAPSRWLSMVSEVDATVTAGPPSAWAAALASVRTGGVDLDLSSLRLGVMAAEVIDPSTVDSLVEIAPSLQLDPRALAAAYGLAEATLGVSVTRPGQGVRVDTLDREKLASTGQALPAGDAPPKRVVSCGAPYPELEVIVLGDDGPCAEREVGRIAVRGPTLLDRYVGTRAPDPFTSDGWFVTGDLGYLAEGELFVTGREKDVIIVMGRNYAPEDLEWAAGQVEGVRRGRCVAFGGDTEDGTVVLIVEPGRRTDPDTLPARVRATVAASTGLTPKVVVADRGAVPKTTSGKLRRSATRGAYVAGQLPVP